jgi:calcineurin-like phosphoesterase family protein
VSSSQPPPSTQPSAHVPRETVGKSIPARSSSPNEGTNKLMRCMLDHLDSPNPWRNGPLAGAGTRQTMKHAQSLAACAPGRLVWEEFRAAPLDKIWVWSDLHLGHKNIIRFTGRAVSSVEDMNQKLLAAAAIIPEDAWVLFGGDLAWKGHMELLTDFLSAVPGRKVLMQGNHDSHRLDKVLVCGFEAVTAVIDMPLTESIHVPVFDDRHKVIERRVDRLWWSHYPLHLEDVDNSIHGDPVKPVSARPPEVPLPSGVLNIHGHIHEKVMRGPFLNISVEQQDLKPERLDLRLARGVLPR